MTKEEIIKRIQSSPEFALRFAFDNNPAGIIDALRQSGYDVTTPGDAYELLQVWLKSPSTNKLAVKLITSVKYNEKASNYTAGLKEWFALKSTPTGNGQAARTGIGWLDSFMTGLGAALTDFSSQGGAAQGPTEAELEAQRKADEEAKRKRNMFIFISILSAIVLIIILYFVFRKKQSEK